MRNSLKAIQRMAGIIALAAVIGFTLAGCGGSGGGPTGGNLELSGTITISPGTATIGTELTATYSGSEAVSFQWKKDGTNVGTNSNKYMPTAAGSYTVTVSATGYNPKTSNAVTVTAGNSGGDTDLSGTITISPNTDVTIGTELTATYSGDEAVSFQWKKDGSDVGTATTTNPNKYTPDTAGIYTVIVSATDYNPKISDAVTVNDPSLPTLTGTITISPSTATVGTELTATYSGDEAVSFQWKKDGSNVGTATTTKPNKYTPDTAGSYTVIVSATGYNPKPSNAVIVTAGSGGGDTDLSGTITISPNTDVTIGTELTATYSGDETVSFQWKKDGSNVGTATTTKPNKYTPDTAGSYTVTVSAPGFNPKTSSAVTVTDPGLPELSGSVSISGTAIVGQTLTATPSINGDGTITYQWKRGGTTVIGTDSTYKIVADDVGATITVTVTRAGYSGSVDSLPTAAVTLPALSGSVTISGTAEVGETLSAVTTALEGSGTISYQWKRNPVTGDAVNIGINSSTYEVQGDDIGSTITVTVTRAGYSGSRDSDPTDTVPELTGTLEISITMEGDAFIDDPRIVDGVLTLSRDDEPVTLTLADADEYGSIGWRVQNTGITGNDSTFTLNPSNPIYLTGRIYFVTVSASRNEIPFDYTISFKVEEE